MFFYNTKILALKCVYDKENAKSTAKELLRVLLNTAHLPQPLWCRALLSPE